MSDYPIAASAADAIKPDAPIARTEANAQARLGCAVYLAVTELPGAYSDIAAAEAAHPGLYGGGRFEVYWRDGAWRVAVRHWRAAPDLPIARDAVGAVRKPLGRARTPKEALERSGAPVELTHETLPRRLRTHAQARAAYKAAFAAGIAEIVERDGRFAVQVNYWRPLDATPEGRLPPADRAELAARAAEPLRGRRMQLPMDMGLFEQPAPENEIIVLAEEGDGRKPWE